MKPGMGQGAKMVEEGKVIVIHSDFPTQPTLLKPRVIPYTALRKTTLLSLTGITFFNTIIRGYCYTHFVDK